MSSTPNLAQSSTLIGKVAFAYTHIPSSSMTQRTRVPRGTTMWFSQSTCLKMLNLTRTHTCANWIQVAITGNTGERHRGRWKKVAELPEMDIPVPEGKIPRQDTESGNAGHQLSCWGRSGTPSSRTQPRVSMQRPQAPAGTQCT